MASAYRRAVWGRKSKVQRADIAFYMHKTQQSIVSSSKSSGSIPKIPNDPISERCQYQAVESCAVSDIANGEVEMVEHGTYDLNGYWSNCCAVSPILIQFGFSETNS
jgi:hypothetical protein